MSNQIDYSDFVEKYLNQNMEQEELEWFYEEMEINPSLAEEVQLQKDIGEAILNEETLAFRAQISNLFEKEEAVKPPKTVKRLSIPPAFRAAVASLAAFIMFGTGIFLYSHRSIPSDKLFEIHYEPYEGLMNVRSGSSQTTDILISAMHKYEQHKYESALRLFETVIATDGENITSKFYSGISYLETERYSIAENSFIRVIDHDDNLFIEHAQWYLGLCYLKTGNDDQAKELFAEIAGSDGYYSNNASRLLRNL